jgi:hypothetical protein
MSPQTSAAAAAERRDSRERKGGAVKKTRWPHPTTGMGFHI